MAGRLALQDVAVEEVMTSHPVTVEPEASLADAAEALLQGGFRHLPVVSPEGRVVGIVSERDVRASLATDLAGFVDATVEARAQPVSGVMTPDPVAVRQGTRIGAVIDLFAYEHVGAVLVVDEAERLRGIVSYVDLLLWFRDHLSGGAEVPPPAPRARPTPAAPGSRRGKGPTRRRASRPGGARPRPAR